MCGRHINGRPASTSQLVCASKALQLVACSSTGAALTCLASYRYAIAVGSLSKYEGTQRKIEMGYKYKVTRFPLKITNNNIIISKNL